MHSTRLSRYKYDATFFKYVAISSGNSARVIVPFVVGALQPLSVLDVGCGAGAWLREYLDQGITDCLGTDGDYVDRRSLLVPESNFRVQDVSQRFDLSRRFHLAQCLEVGEHIHSAASETLVENLTSHSDRVLFSAAVPGQGGENHINERPYEFWRNLFADRGYIPFDFIRPIIKHLEGADPWYRYNLLLYVSKEVVPGLPDSVKRTGILAGEPVRDVWPVKYKFRRALLRHMPIAVASQLAVLKHASMVAFSKVRRPQDSSREATRIK